jgi:predicted nucleic acid-binding protein
MDASALVKLYMDETESVALRRYAADGGPLMSTVIAAVEVGRVTLRRGFAPFPLASDVNLFEVTSEVVELASSVDPPTLRALDAIHVATALLLPQINAFVAYDERLLSAAEAAGLPTASPA